MIYRKTHYVPLATYVQMRRSDVVTGVERDDQNRVILAADSGQGPLEKVVTRRFWWEGCGTPFNEVTSEDFKPVGSFTFEGYVRDVYELGDARPTDERAEVSRDTMYEDGAIKLWEAADMLDTVSLPMRDDTAKLLLDVQACSQELRRLSSLVADSESLAVLSAMQDIASHARKVAVSVGGPELEAMAEELEAAAEKKKVTFG